MMKKFFALLAFTAMVTMAYAQQTGNIVGTVKDTSGAAIPGVTVTLTNTATTTRRTVVTNSEGEYNAFSLLVGDYVVSAEMTGFQKLNRSSVTLTTANTLNVDLVLQVGSETTTVDVTTQVSLLQSQSGVVSSLVDSKQVVNLPLVSRNFTDLVLLTPGAHTGSSTNLTEGAGAYSIRGGANFSVNGSVAAANSYLIDGLYDRNQWLNTLVMVPIVDSISEYRVMTSNFNAEYGEAAGAVTTVTTKSGTNSVHGAVWEFLRNERGNANPYFLNSAGVPRTAYRRNVFGANIGAPIWKNHTFIFGDYQGIRQTVPTASTVTIPTQAQAAMVKTGDFSALLTAGCAGYKVNASGLAICPNNATNPNQLYNPYNVVSGKRQPFANNNLSALRDPAAVNLISLLPAPTNSTATNNYTIAPASVLTDDQFDVRLDQNIKKSDSLFLKYSFDRPHQGFPGTIYPVANASIQVGPYLATGGSGYETAVQTQSGTIGYSHIFNPSLLLEAHAGILRWYADIAPYSQSINSATAIGIPGINYNSLSGGLPAISISGFAILGDNSTYPEDSRITTFQYDADVIKTVGTHTFKTGVLFLRHRFNGFSSFPVRGNFDFNGQFTSQIAATNTAPFALADFAIGAEDNATRNILQGEFGMRSFQIAGYAQDAWRITDRLTLEYGLRYEVTTPPYEVHNHWANLNINTGQLLVAGLNGNGRRLRNTDYNTLGPRLGFSYTPDNSRKTVLRGGFGMSYVDVLVGGSQLYKNLPYFFAQTVTTSSTLAPPTTLSAGMPTPVPPDPNNIAAISTGSPTVWNMNNREVGVIQYSLGVQRQLRPDTVAEISYVGTRSEHLMINPNLNQARPGPGAVASRRPYNTINPNLVNVNYRTSGGDAHYDSLQAHIEKRLSGGINFGASYTYAKFLTNAGNPNGGGNVDIQDSQCIYCNYGSAPDDYRHTFVFNHVWQLPFGTGRKYLNSGFLSYIVGPWNFSGIWTKYSGGHFTATYATNVSNSSGGGTQRPNRIANGNLSSGDRTITKWFDTSAFVAPAQYTFGNSGTGILVGPGYFNVNLTLERNLLVRERYNIDLRGEAFNAFNHANFNNPNASIGTSNAGVISGTKDARILQVALKISF